MRTIVAALLVWAAFLVASTVSVQAQERPEWIYVGLSSAGNELYIRPKDVEAGRKSRGEIPFWVKSEGSGVSVQTLYILNCTTRTTRVTYHIIALSDGKTRVETERIPVVEIVAPDSPLSPVVDYICTGL